MKKLTKNPMKKTLLYGALVGLIMIAVGVAASMAINVLMPEIGQEYNKLNLFRQWDEPVMSLYFVGPFLLGIILAWFWEKTKTLFKKCKKGNRGICFGFCDWVITIPGMIITYASFQISVGMILSWTLVVLLQTLVAGWLYEKLLK